MVSHRKKILLIDGHGLAFRAFYAIPELNAPDGTPTNAVVGFLNMLSKIWKSVRPDAIFTAFDMKGPTFRHELLPDYKGTRKAPPDAFKAQIPLLHEALPLLGIQIMERRTIEADDLLGAAAVTIAERGDEAVIVSSDKDILQVLRDGIKIVRPGKGVSQFSEATVESFSEEFGFPPEKMVDYLAIMGDKVDNIQGVPGVGEKTAAKLLRSYSSIEGIMEHVEELSPSLRKKFTENYGLAIGNRMLTRLRCEEPVDEFLSSLPAPDMEAFGRFCSRLGIRRFAGTFDELVSGTSKPIEKETADSASHDDTASRHDAEKNESVSVGAEAISPSGEIPLGTILCAPRVALDINVNKPCIAPDDEFLGSVDAIIAAPDGSFWQGRFTELETHMQELFSNKVICLDAKTLCSLMKEPRSDGLFDIKTAWYLLHPDLEEYDISSRLGLAFSPERALKLLGEAKSLEAELTSQGTEKVLSGIDVPLVPVLVGMERCGIRLLRDEMTALAGELDSRIADISAQIREAAGWDDINLNSPKQIGELLFERLGLPPVKKTKTGFSTNVAVLEQLRDAFGESCKVPALLLEFRELQKMSSGFVSPLLAAAGRDGIIHSTFEALTTGTGRLSSRDPNMQNLPAYSGWGKRIRECLVPAHEGNRFIAADYSQIELRVLAHLSGDSRLIDIFRGERDIHTETASLVFGLPPCDVTKELRRNAKTVSFGLIYGMSAFGLASRLGCDRSTASILMKAYFAALPGVKNYLDSAKNKALSERFTTTMFGRRRSVDEITTGKGTADHLARAAVNSPIQGTAADITKIAMCKAAEHFKGKSTDMVLQVHDSIVCECPADKAEDYARELAEVMESAVELSVPLKTQTAIGKSLAEV